MENDNSQSPFPDNHIMSVINRQLKNSGPTSTSDHNYQLDVNEIVHENEKLRKQKKEYWFEHRRKRKVTFLKSLKLELAQMNYNEQLKLLKQKKHELNLDLIEHEGTLGTTGRCWCWYGRRRGIG